MFCEPWMTSCSFSLCLCIWLSLIIIDISLCWLSPVCCELLWWASRNKNFEQTAYQLDRWATEVLGNELISEEAFMKDQHERSIQGKSILTWWLVGIFWQIEDLLAPLLVFREAACTCTLSPAFLTVEVVKLDWVLLMLCIFGRSDVFSETFWPRIHLLAFRDWTNVFRNRIALDMWWVNATLPLVTLKSRWGDLDNFWGL